MPRYTYSEERLQAKIAKFENAKIKNQIEVEFRKRRELMRRRMNASLYAPRVCMGDPVTGQTCDKWAVPGATLCQEHGGTTRAMQNAAKMRLLCLVEPALRVLNKAMASSEIGIAVKAAQIILDRSGFHPHATLEVQEKPMDLANMSDRDLKNRAQRLLQAMDNSVPTDIEDFEDEPTPPSVN